MLVLHALICYSREASLIAVLWIIVPNIEAIIRRQGEQSLHGLKRKEMYEVLKLLSSGTAYYRIELLCIPAWEVRTSRSYIGLSSP